MPTALITGASAGLGKALTTELPPAAGVSSSPPEARTGSTRRRRVARHRSDGSARLTAIAGDVADPDHREATGRRDRPSSVRSTCW